MANKFRWGIIGTGRIASDFASDLRLLDDAEIVAVGSRSQQSADDFGQKFGVPHRYATYEQVGNDPAVDIVYVATPHMFHHENTLMALRAGKHVLCEKAFAINAKQAQEMIALARAKRLFLMDAIWSRFFPAYVHIREMIAAGKLGDVRMVLADFGFKPEFNPHSRLFNPALAGGALLDIGVYPVMLASMVFGPPEKITASGHLGVTGVDEQIGIVFNYADGRMAVLSATFQAQSTQEAHIIGTEGRIRLCRKFWEPAALGVALGDQPEERVEFPIEGNGLHYEAVEVMRCVREGQTESAIMPLDETLSIMQTLDAIREQIGLRYPGE